MTNQTVAEKIRSRLGLTEEEWLRFLLDEGLEVFAAYRAISDRSVRQMFLHRMQEAGVKDRNGDARLN